MDTPVKKAPPQAEVVQSANQGSEVAPQASATDQASATQKNTHAILFRVQEGRQLFIRNILVTGLHYTRPGTIAKAITIKAGDPLSKSQMATTQRNLYDFALFSEVNMAVVNPVSTASLAADANAALENGTVSSAIPTIELPRTVLIQTTEASRWSFTYGLGFEASTGNCGLFTSNSSTCPVNGKTGVSPRVLLDISRGNLSGRDQSLSLRGTYGLLEQKVNLLYEHRAYSAIRIIGFNISSGYANT